jgi:hypothetical protein
MKIAASLRFLKYPKLFILMVINKIKKDFTTPWEH